MTSMRRNDVASTSFRRHVPTRLLINQCQIITFLILKSDILENSRIELRGIVLPVPSNQIKVTFIVFGTFVIFFLFHIEIEGKGGWIIGGGGGGGKGYVAPPLPNYWGAWPPLPPPPLPTPMIAIQIRYLTRKPQIGNIFLFSRKRNLFPLTQGINESAHFRFL